MQGNLLKKLYKNKQLNNSIERLSRIMKYCFQEEGNDIAGEQKDMY